VPMVERARERLACARRKADKWFMVVDSQLGLEYNALGHFRFSPDCINALADWSQRADGEGANLD